MCVRACMRFSQDKVLDTKVRNTKESFSVSLANGHYNFRLNFRERATLNTIAL